MLRICGADFSRKRKLITQIPSPGSQRAAAAGRASQLTRQRGSTSVTSYLISVSPPVSDSRREKPLTRSAEESLSSPRGVGGLEWELLVRSAWPGADMALTAAKSLQTTGQMCFIWALSVDTSCLRCMRRQHYTAAPKAEAETPDLKPELWPGTFSLCAAVTHHSQ